MRENRDGVLQAGVIVVVLIAIVFLGMIVASASTGNPLRWFTQDPTYTYDGEGLAGVQSHIGVLALWSAASVLLFTWWLTRERGGAGGSFLLVSGLLSALLAADDLFRFHDDLWGRVTGRHERWLFLIYGLLFLAWLIWYRRSIFSINQALLLIGIAFLVIAIGSDMIESRVEALLGEEFQPVFEDGVKFIGFVFWSAGLLLHCTRTLRASIAPSDPGTPTS